MAGLSREAAAGDGAGGQVVGECGLAYGAGSRGGGPRRGVRAWLQCMYASQAWWRVAADAGGLGRRQTGRQRGAVEGIRERTWAEDEDSAGAGS